MSLHVCDEAIKVIHWICLYSVYAFKQTQSSEGLTEDIDVDVPRAF